MHGMMLSHLSPSLSLFDKMRKTWLHKLSFPFLITNLFRLFPLKKVLNAYLDYMTQVGVLLGGEENSTRQQMEQVLELEIKIANVRI